MFGIHKDDIYSVLKTYHLMSQRWYTHASPTLFNVGTRRPQLSSCFLLCVKHDSVEGIYDSLKERAVISTGGIGVSVHNIHATCSYIRGTNGTSNGIVPMLRVFNDLLITLIKEDARGRVLLLCIWSHGAVMYFNF